MKTFAFHLEGESHLLQTGQSSYPDDGFGQRTGGNKEEEKGAGRRVILQEYHHFSDDGVFTSG